MSTGIQRDEAPVYGIMRSVLIGFAVTAAAATGVVAGGYLLDMGRPPQERRVSSGETQHACPVEKRLAESPSPVEEPKHPVGQADEPSVTVCNVAAASVRETPSDTAEQVTEALFGHQLPVQERGDGWLRVRVVEQDYPGWAREEATAEVPARWSERRRVVTVDGTQPISSQIDVRAPVGWPARLPAGSVVMIADGIKPGMVEATAPEGDNAWLPTGNLGPTVPSSSGKAGGERIVAVARAFLGTSYEWGGMTRNGIDCSGLVWVSHFACGYIVPRDSGPQSRTGQTVSRDALRPGDCLFFGSSGDETHVGIYLGDGQFIHATPPQVTISDFGASPHAQRFIRARRFTTASSARVDAPIVVVDTDRAAGNHSPRNITSAIQAEVSVACPIVGYRELTLSLLADYDPAALVLSGQGTPWWNYSATELEDISSVLQRTDLPVLGICGGHQLLALAFGGSVAPIDGPRRGSDYANCKREKGWTEVQVAIDDPLLAGLRPSIEVWENHCEEVRTVPPGFITAGQGDLSKYQAIRHPSRPLWGTQFHPEVGDTSSDGRRVLRSFLQVAGVM